MDFPAIKIFPLTLLVKHETFMSNDDPLFAFNGYSFISESDPLFVSNGLINYYQKIISCAVISAVRGNKPCGLSMLCCCTSVSDIAVLPNCTSQYRQNLLDAL